METSWRKLQFLQHYQKNFPWVAKTLNCQIHFWKNVPSSVLHFTSVPESRKLLIYVFSALALHLHGNERLEEETSNLFNLFLEKTIGIDPTNLRGVCMEDVAAAECVVQAEIFLYDINIVDGSMTGELPRRTVGKIFVQSGYWFVILTVAMSLM